MRRQFLSALICTLWTLSCAHAADNNGNDENTVRIQIDNTDTKPWTHFGSVIPRATFDIAVNGQALKFTPDFHIKPGYIKSWEWDYKTNAYTFKMDRSLKYPDGRSISAYDFEFAIVKTFITTEPTRFPFTQFTSIPGVEVLKRGLPFRTGMVSGIKVVDDETILISLKNSPHRFLYALSSVFPALAPREAFKDDFYTYKALPYGSGPYKVSSIDDHKGMVRLERVNNTTGPKFVELFYKNLGWQNKVDIAYGTGMSKMKTYSDEHPGEYIQSQGEIPDSIEVLEFNYSTKAGSNLAFRKAVAMAIDKDAKIKGYSGLVGTDQIIPSQSYGHRTSKTYFNLKNAKTLFASLPADIREATHTIMFHGDPKNKNIGNYYSFILDSLKAIGMKVNPSMAEFVAFQGQNKDTTMGVYGWTVDADPVNTFSYYTPDGGKKNFTLKDDHEIKETFSKLEVAESLEERVKYVHSMTDLLIEKMIVLPIHEGYPVIFHKPRIKNINFIDINGIIDVSLIEVSRADGK